MSRPIPKHTKIAVRAKKGATSLQLKDEMVLEPDQVGWVLRESVIIMQFRVIRGSGKFMDIAPHKYKIETNYLNGDLVIFGPVLHESELEERWLTHLYTRSDPTDNTPDNPAERE